MNQGILQGTGQGGRRRAVRATGAGVETINVEHAASEGTNLAGDATATASSYYTAAGFVASHVNDGNLSTAWASEGGDSAPWLQLDRGAGALESISAYSLRNTGAGGAPIDWVLKASGTGDWTGEETTIDTITDGGIVSGETKFFAMPENGDRYLRWYFTDWGGKGDANVCGLDELGLLVGYSTIPVNSLIALCGIQPPILLNSEAPTNCLYYSSDAGKLVYKDLLGTVNSLY